MASSDPSPTVTGMDPRTTSAASGTSRPQSRPQSLSPSRASDFTTCPLLFRFRVVDRLPEPPSVDALRGTVVHSVLDQLFDLPAQQRTPAEAVGLVGPAWERLVERDPGVASLFDDEGARTAWLDGARELVARWFTLEDPSRLEPAARELYVETQLAGGLTLRGYVDRLDVAPTGETRVVDYKTGKAPAPAYEGRAMFQLRFYALVLWRARGQIPTSLQLVYLGSGEVLRYAPDEADLLATERRISAIWSAIEQAAAAGDWRPRPSRLCDWCHHRALCPAWGGTPPPLPTG